MTITDQIAYTHGVSIALNKLGMEASHRDLVKRLQEAVADEEHGKDEYGQTAEEAERLGLSDIEELARSHQADEERHRKENSEALSTLNMRG